MQTTLVFDTQEEEAARSNAVGPTVISPTETTVCNTLLSPTILKYLRKSFQFGEYICSHPYTWVKGENRLEMVPKWKKNIWLVNMLFAFLHASFLLCRFLQVTLDEERIKFDKIYMQFILAYFAMATILHLGIIQNQTEIANFVNGYLAFIQVIKEQYMGDPANIRKQPLTRVIELSMQMTYVIFCTMIPLVTFSALAYPAPDQLSSFFPKNTVIIRLASSVIAGYAETLYMSSAILMALGVLFPFPTMLLMIDELDGGSCKFTAPKLRRLQEKLRMYQALHLSMARFNSVYSSLVLPGTKLLLSVNLVLCTYGAIRMTGVTVAVFILVGAFNSAFLALFFTSLSGVHGRSLRLVSSWRRRRAGQEESKWFQKKVLALRSIKCVVCSMYYVDHGMVLTMLSAIVKETVSYLCVNS